MIRNIIFDWSGVLDDNFDVTHHIINKLFAKYGAEPISKTELKRNWRQPYMEFYNQYLPNLTEGKEQDFFFAEHQKLPPFKFGRGLRELLEQFDEAGLKMIILSSDPSGSIESKLKQVGSEKLFDKIYHDIHDKRKIIKQVLTENNLDPKETVIVGDTPHEIDTGRVGNIKTIAVTWGYKSRAVLEKAKPDWIADTPAELGKILIDGKEN